MTHKKKRLRTLAAIICAAAAAVALLVLFTSGDDTKTDTTAVADVALVSEMLDGVPQNGVTLGDPDAPITVTEFADMQCPFCAEAGANTIPPLVQDYVRSGKVKVEFRDMAFLGEDSVKLARVVAAAGLQNRAWDAAELLYRNQGEENSGYATDEYIERVLSKIQGLDVAKVMKDRDASAVEMQISEAKGLAQKHGVQSTPTFLVDGKPVDGADYAALKAAIDG